MGSLPLTMIFCVWIQSGDGTAIAFASIRSLSLPEFVRSVHSFAAMGRREFVPDPTSEEMGSSGDDNCPKSAIRRVHSQCQTGSLLFSTGDCLAVRAYTGSRYTHVAAVVESEGKIWVYDAMNGRGVRKLSLEEYLEIQTPDEVTLLQPCRSFTADEAASFRAALERDLGRPYSVRQFLSQRRTEARHCSEYITDAFIEIDWLRAENPAHVSPASLLAGITQHAIYWKGETIRIPPRLVPIPEPAGWCARVWYDSQRCLSDCCALFSRSVLCR